MCGISGICSIRSNVERGWLDAASAAMAHRGPDQSGRWNSDDNIASLSHRRLSIFDLSEYGIQPIVDESGDVAITFNGAIYNYQEIRNKLKLIGYKFRSETDTEVLLKAYIEWGPECLNLLNGMFSFSIYDSRNKKLFSARDRVGEKPFFYRHDNNGLVFASELKSLLDHAPFDKTIDSDAFEIFLSSGYIPNEMCLVKGYKKLPAGHYMIYDALQDKLEVTRYWNLPEVPTEKDSLDEHWITDELDQRLRASVKMQLQADVPVGVLLSGGVDSSLIVALAAQTGRKIDTFNVRFDAASKYDESKHAKLIAKHFGTQHHEIRGEDLTADSLFKLLSKLDEPMVDSSILPTWLVCQAVSKHCKVILGGDGGDELFGGYVHYKRLLKIKRILKKMPLQNSFKNLMELRKLLPIGTRGFQYLDAISGIGEETPPQMLKLFDSSWRKKLGFGLSKYNSADQIHEKYSFKHDNIIEAQTRTDFLNYLAEDILVKVDRASMLNSIEMRAPFLDVNVIDFAFGQIPSNYKVSESKNKIILKRLAQNYLPTTFEYERKQGFSIPLNKMLKTDKYRNLFSSILLDASCSFDRRAISRLFYWQDKGFNNGERILALTQFEIWRKRFGVSF